MVSTSNKRIFSKHDDQMAIQHAKRGLEFYKKKNFAYALRSFKKAYKMPIKKEFASVLLIHMANIMGELNFLDEQQKFVEELMSIDASLKSIELLVEVYHKSNNEKKLMELASKIKSIETENEEEENKAIDLLLITKDYAEVINRTLLYLENHPNEEKSMKRLLSTYIQANRIEDAYNYSMEITSSGLEDKFYLELSHLEKELFDFEKSRDYILQHFEIHKDNAFGVNKVAYTLMTNANYNGTIKGDEYIYWANRAHEGTKPVQINTNIKRNLNPFRKTRVGFISYDFRKHSVGKFILSLFSYLNKESCIETYCYYTHPEHEDDFTSIFKDTANVFKSVGKYTDILLEKTLIADELDVLIDLNGQTAGSKLSLLAKRFAPIQITWMGFPFSSFYYNIDYIIGDYYFDDDEGVTEKYCTEKVLKMEPCYMCFSLMPEVMYIEPEPPQVYNGYITLGMMNNPLKYSEESIKLWQKCLDNIPDSRLLIQLSKFGPGFVQSKLKERFVKYGLDIERVDFGLDFGQDGYYRTYNKCDVMLESLPFGGGTTTPEALWMGVPVIGCKYDMRHGRMAYSFMSNIGLGDLCADSVETYSDKVKEVAENVDFLRDLRVNLRDNLKEKPLYDKKLFRLGFENAMRDAFINYCYEDSTKEPLDVIYYKNNDYLLIEDCIRAGEIILNILGKESFDEVKFLYLLDKYIEIHDYMLFRLSDVYKDDNNIMSIIANTVEMIEVLLKPNDISIINTVVNSIYITISKLINRG